MSNGILSSVSRISKYSCEKGTFTKQETQTDKILRPSIILLG